MQEKKKEEEEARIQSPVKFELNIYIHNPVYAKVLIYNEPGAPRVVLL